MTFFFVLHTVGSWLGWGVLRSMRERAHYLIEIDRHFTASEANMKRLKTLTLIAEICLSTLLWPAVVLAFVSDRQSFTDAYVFSFHQKVLALYTRASADRRES